jgi:hypothetical protein
MDSVAVLAMLDFGEMKSLMDMKFRWLQAAFRTAGTDANAKRLIEAKLNRGKCPLI